MGWVRFLEQSPKKQFFIPSLSSDDLRQLTSLAVEAQGLLLLFEDKEEYIGGILFKCIGVTLFCTLNMILGNFLAA